MHGVRRCCINNRASVVYNALLNGKTIKINLLQFGVVNDKDSKFMPVYVVEFFPGYVINDIDLI